MFAVLKREFRSYFQNVIGWLFVAALMALFGLYFYVYNLRQGYPYLYYTLSAITIIFMIAVPIPYDAQFCRGTGKIKRIS